jgi:hypothetical protein
MPRPFLEVRPQLLKDTCDLLEKGITIPDMAARLGYGASTFHNWRARGMTEIDRRIEQGDADKLSGKEQRRRDKEQLYVDFLEATMRAEADARIAAVEVLRAGMQPSKIESATIETFSETRLNKKGEPYVYTRTTKKTSMTQQPGDWRAALEYLKRRDVAQWSERHQIKVDDWRSEAIEYIRRGELSFEALAEEFDRDLATELFKAAGVPVQAG